MEHAARAHNHALSSDTPETPSSDDIAVTESFVISLHSVSSIMTGVNQAHQQVFAQSSRPFESILPTKSAMVEHVKRMTHQAGYVWERSIIAKQVLPAGASRVESNLKPAGFRGSREGSPEWYGSSWFQI